MAKHKKMVKMSKTKQMKNLSFQHFEKYFFTLFSAIFANSLDLAIPGITTKTLPNQTNPNRAFTGLF